MNQIGFYFDQTRCIGCYTCVVACKDWHDINAGEGAWRWIIPVEKGRYPDVFAAYLSLSCLHCAEPACIPACPAGAVTKRDEDGIVVVDSEACLGNSECGMFCKEACPYDAPRFGAEEGAKMQKCHLCAERWHEDKKPICVDSCPMRALDAGPIAELVEKYGDAREAEGFLYQADLEPSVIFTSKQSKP